MTNQPLSHGLAHARTRLIAAQRPDHPEACPALARRDSLPLEDPSNQVQRRRQVWALKPQTPVISVDVADPKALLKADETVSANCPKKAQRLTVAAEQDVLTIVDWLPCSLISKRRCATAESGDVLRARSRGHRGR